MVEESGGLLCQRRKNLNERKYDSTMKIEGMEHVDIFQIFPMGQKDQWNVWYDRGHGYVEMHSDQEWTCREDVEDYVFRRMLDGKK